MWADRSVSTFLCDDKCAQRTGERMRMGAELVRWLAPMTMPMGDVSSFHADGC